MFFVQIPNFVLQTLTPWSIPNTIDFSEYYPKTLNQKPSIQNPQTGNLQTFQTQNPPTFKPETFQPSLNN